MSQSTISTQKDQLHFMICGSVDDGKSTLLGRILYESNAILQDQMSALLQESAKYGTQKSELDLALLVDGLQAEREQGITIDIAYRYFETSKRKFIATDTPGHLEYTRNMATAASDAKIAIMLVDARAGILEQTRRHSYICALMGVGHIVLAVNKMDCVEYQESIFVDIAQEYEKFQEKLKISTGNSLTFTAIPISALQGDNISKGNKGNLDWYQGLALLEFLEEFTIVTPKDENFIFPVQWVNRPNSTFRGLSGTIAAGNVTRGAEIIVQPSGQKSVIQQIITPQQEDAEQAIAEQAITLVLQDNIDASRGDFITHPNHSLQRAEQFAGYIIAMHEKIIHSGRSYWLQSCNQIVNVTITDIRYQIDVNSLEHIAVKSLAMNHIAMCHFKTEQPIIFANYPDNKKTGSFLLIDRTSYVTLGAGMFVEPLQRDSNIVWHDMKVTQEIRGQQKNQKPCILWFTGLSASGKSSIADRVEQKLQQMHHHTYLLDGDNVRRGINQDLGFNDADRVENIRRIAYISKLMVDAGLIVLVSFISPYRSERGLARQLVGDDEFIEIYIDTPLKICEQRDPKGLYKKARAGEIKNFTGMGSLYEPPENPEIILSTQGEIEETADQLINWLQTHNYLHRL